MARKRSPEHDYICKVCTCPCDQYGSRHLGGGQNMRACKGPPQPVLRSEWESMVAEFVAGAMDALRRR